MFIKNDMILGNTVVYRNNFKSNNRLRVYYREKHLDDFDLCLQDDYIVIVYNLPNAKNFCAMEFEKYQSQFFTKKQFKNFKRFKFIGYL